MEDVALVGKTRGQNPSQGKMEELVRRNWMGFQGKDPEITPLEKGWFEFHFGCKEDVDSEQGETLYSRRRTKLCFHPREVGRRSNIKDKMYMQM